MIRTCILINGENMIESGCVDFDDHEEMYGAHPCPRMSEGDVFWFDSEITGNRYKLKVTESVLEMIKEEDDVAPSWFQTIKVDLSDRCHSNWR